MGHVSDPHGFEGSLGNSGADGGKLKIACAGAESMYLPAEQFPLFHITRENITLASTTNIDLVKTFFFPFFSALITELGQHR